MKKKSEKKKEIKDPFYFIFLKKYPEYINYYKLIFSTSQYLHIFLWYVIS